MAAAVISNLTTSKRVSQANPWPERRAPITQTTVDAKLRRDDDAAREAATMALETVAEGRRNGCNGSRRSAGTFKAIVAGADADAHFPPCVWTADQSIHHGSGRFIALPRRVAPQVWKPIPCGA